MLRRLLPCLLLSTVAVGAEPRLLVIGIDGVRPDGLAAAHTPHLDSLMAQGTFSLHALTHPPTVSGPGWSAMLTGVWHDKHNVTSNNFTAPRYDLYPDFMSRLEAAHPDLNTVSIVHWGPVNTQILQADEEVTVASDLQVATEAARRLRTGDPHVIFLHFDDVDAAGHGTAFDPRVPEYIAEIEDVDRQVGVVRAALAERPTRADEDWLILSSTDHGGFGSSHGGASPEERTIYVIAAGDGVPQRQIGLDPACDTTDVDGCAWVGTPRIVDIAVTGLVHMGVEIDPAWGLDGRVLVRTAGSTTVVPDSVAAPMLTVHPNPFVGETVLRLVAPAVEGAVSIALYNSLGQRVREWHLSGPVATQVDVAWDGRVDGEEAASGVYLVRAEGPWGRCDARLSVVRR